MSTTDLRLKDLVEGIRTLLTDELGLVRGTSLKAVFVEPGTIPEDVVGIRCVINRNPEQLNRTGMKVTGGTYFPDYFKLSLINFTSNKSDPIAAQKMADAIKKIEINYSVALKRYKEPTSDVYEQCQLWLFSPILAIK